MMLKWIGKKWQDIKEASQSPFSREDKEESEIDYEKMYHVKLSAREIIELQSIMDDHWRDRQREDPVCEVPRRVLEYIEIEP